MVPQSIEVKIFKQMKRAGAGKVFFPDNFIDHGSSEAIRKALQRLVEKEKINKLAHGIYYIPAVSPLIGPLKPSIGDVAKALAARDHAKIIPTGSQALNMLGLSTQVVTNYVYHTDGSARIIKIGKNTIRFKKSTPKSLATIGEISTLAIQALKEIGKGLANEEEILKIQKILEKENPAALAHDIRMAPDWIRQIMRPSLNKLQHG